MNGSAKDLASSNVRQRAAIADDFSKKLHLWVCSNRVHEYWAASSSFSLTLKTDCLSLQRQHSLCLFRMRGACC